MRMYFNVNFSFFFSILISFTKLRAPVVAEVPPNTASFSFDKIPFRFYY